MECTGGGQNAGSTAAKVLGNKWDFFLTSIDGRELTWLWPNSVQSHSSDRRGATSVGFESVTETCSCALCLSQQRRQQSPHVFRAGSRHSVRDLQSTLPLLLGDSRRELGLLEQTCFSPRLLSSLPPHLFFFNLYFFFLLVTGYRKSLAGTK